MHFVAVSDNASCSLAKLFINFKGCSAVKDLHAYCFCASSLHKQIHMLMILDVPYWHNERPTNLHEQFTTLKGPSQPQPHLCFCLHTRIWLLYFIRSVSKRRKSLSNYQRSSSIPLGTHTYLATFYSEMWKRYTKWYSIPLSPLPRFLPLLCTYFKCRVNFLCLCARKNVIWFVSWRAGIKVGTWSKNNYAPGKSKWKCFWDWGIF